MADLYDEQRGWPQGVLTAPPADSLPPGAVRSAANAELVRTGTGQALYRKRRGVQPVHSAAINNPRAGAPTEAYGDPPVAVADYPYQPGATDPTYYSVVVTDIGQVRTWQEIGSPTSTLTLVSGTALSNPCTLVDWTVANNRLFIVDDGGGKLSLRGTAATDWGVPLVTYGGSPTSLSAGSMSGDYDLLLVGYNSDLLEESDWAPIISVTGLSSQQITVTVNAVAAGLTHRWWRIYLRKRSLGGDFYRVLSGTGYNSTHQAFALHAGGATVSTTINITDAAFLLLVTRPAAEGTRQLPIAGAKFITWWRRRLFLATDTTIYWSEIDRPDAFGVLNFQTITDGRGGQIRAIKTVFDRVVILTTSGSRWELAGDDDDRSWLLQMTDVESSSIDSPRAFAVVNGAAYWWTRSHGPVRWTGGSGPPDPIGWQTVRPSFEGVINPAALQYVVVAGTGDRVIFGFPELGTTHVNHLMTWRADLGVWESEFWDPMEVRALGAVTATDRTSKLILGNWVGQMFRLNTGHMDGENTGVTSSTFSTGGTSVSQLSFGGGTWTAGSGGNTGWAGRKITVLDNTGKPILVGPRPVIFFNDSTTIHFTPSVTGLTPFATYTVIIGGPDFRLETGWRDLGRPFVSKRFDQAMVQFEVDVGVTQFRLDSAYEFDEIATGTTGSAPVGSGILDVTLLDEFYLGNTLTATRKTWLGKIARNYRLRVLNAYANQGFTVTKLLAIARELTPRWVSPLM